jgi:hypothetical protein
MTTEERFPACYIVRHLVSGVAYDVRCHDDNLLAGHTVNVRPGETQAAAVDRTRDSIGAFFGCPECRHAWERPWPMPDDDIWCPLCGYRDEARHFWPEPVDPDEAERVRASVMARIAEEDQS